MDSIAFIPGDKFIRRKDSDTLNDYSLFLLNNKNKIVEGNYFEITNLNNTLPDIYIFIDLDINISLDNFENRYQKYLGISREELTGQIEDDPESMRTWIKSYKKRRYKFIKQIKDQKVIMINNMNELNNIDKLIDLIFVKSMF